MVYVTTLWCIWLHCSVCDYTVVYVTTCWCIFLLG